MDYLFYLLLVALITYGIGSFVLESFGSIVERRKSRPGQSSGAETAIGNSAVVTTSFAAADNGEIRGRVRVDGEDWNALFVGDASTPPARDDQVTVVEVDTGSLEVRVK